MGERRLNQRLATDETPLTFITSENRRPAAYSALGAVVLYCTAKFVSGKAEDEQTGAAGLYICEYPGDVRHGVRYHQYMAALIAATHAPTPVAAHHCCIYRNF